jgi:hypothetical protein
MPRLLHFSSIAFLALIAIPPTIAAGPPTAVSNLPVVPGERPKAKRPKKDADSKKAAQAERARTPEKK